VAFELELVHTQDNNPKWNMPYTPAIRVRGGTTIYVAGVTAGPVYHSHPHVLAEFQGVPADAGQQATMAFDNLENVLRAAGASLDDVVQLFRFIVDIDRNQDAINAVQATRMSNAATSTTVEVTRLASAPGLWLELTAVAAVADRP
jgi:enamine deaminase RidA (YjgF/YER057c/UK114 family)